LEEIKRFFMSTAGAFTSSESPIEARNLKATANESVASAGVFAPKDPNRQSEITTTTSTTTESTLPPIIDTTHVSPPEDTINYGENFPT
jgi:hypothetical protein